MPSAPSPDASSPSEAVALARLHPTAFTYFVHPRYAPADLHWRIGDALARIESGMSDRLLVLVPPRFGKSELASIHFPAWCLGRHPDRRIIATSYNEQLARHFGRQARDLVASPAFRRVFPGLGLAADGTAADEWRLQGASGSYLAAGIGGSITGYGADLLLVDDPIKNREEADSAVFRERTWDWFQSVAYSRLEPGGRIVVTMARWHPDDLAGRLLRATAEGRDRWEVLELPALSAEGQPLWPERFDREALERIRLALDERTWSALYQQQPTSERGTVFQRDWLARYDGGAERARVAVARIISVDTAYKDGEEHDYSCALVADLMPDYTLELREVWRERVPFPDLAFALDQLCARWNRDDQLRWIVIEDSGAGTSLLQTLRAWAPAAVARALVSWKPAGAKRERARLASVWMRNGLVRLPRPSESAPWLFELERELLEFPGSLHDDQVDALTQAILFLENLLADSLRARAG